MVGIPKFSDFSQAISSLKLSALKKQNDGAEAPRNSLEFTREASQSYQVIDEDIPYSCQAEKHLSKANDCIEAPCEWLIDAEISTRSQERCIRPNLVARLMGMDTLPSETKPMIHVKERKKKVVCEENHKVTPTHHASLILKSMKRKSKELLPYVEQNSSQHMKSHPSLKPKLREHPQQDLLQKFKKDFEAWQASKVWEKARTFQLRYESLNVYKSGNGAESSSLDFNGVKAVRHMDANKCSCVKKTESRNHVSSAKQKKDAKRVDLLMPEGWINGKNKYVKRKDIGLKDRAINNSVVLSAEGKEQRSSSPRRIVIIQPTIEMNNDSETSCLSSPSWLPLPERTRKEVDMQEFLEKVKKKLEFEVQERNRLNSQTRWTKDDTFFNQISFDTKQVKENAIKDYNPTLVRSTSNRFASEIQLNELKFPQVIMENTQRSFLEKMKNGLRYEKDVQFPSDTYRSTLSTKEGAMFKPNHYFSEKDKEVSYCKENKVVEERKNMSFLYEYCHNMISNCEEVPSRKLARSFSAPMATTALGNLLSEDKQEKTEAGINGKSKASENELIKAQKVRKDIFNLKNRLSSLRHNLITKGKLFGKKMHLIDEAAMDETPFLRTTMTQSVIMNSDLLQDNLTEVPPSPASLCSSSYDFYKLGYPSPVSPLEAPFVEEHTTGQVLGELSSIFPELDQEEIVKDEEPEEGVRKREALKAEDDMRSFLRDLLVISGLFDREPFNHLFAGCDSLTKPIPKWIYYKVEEKYSNSRSEPGTHLSCDDQVQLSHRMLFDLLNEGFFKAVQTPMASHTSREWYFGPRRIPPGQKLLDNIWNQIQLLVKPPAEGSYNLNYIVNWDLNRTPWSAASQDGIYEIGLKVELLILRDLIDELVLELKS